MAVNTAILSPRIAERKLFSATAIAFPLIVLIGYFKSYYFSAFFDVPAVANKLVHAHGIVMSVWVLYFVAQTALIRTRNVKLHMTMGMFGVALAIVVIVVGMATAYDAQLVRGAAPPGVDPHGFFVLPASDMLLFAIFFSGAIYYRKRPTEHKSLMFLTAIAFVPAALFRIPVVAPENALVWAFGTPAIFAVAALAWHTWKTGKLNRVFASGVSLLLIAVPLRPVVMESQAWLSFVGWLAP
ncbi:MAG: hypothetical protein JNK51_10115 [Blastocatellia bacterium]|nr:hypothetical protein [Chloracidobacterium sp.]MBL8185268.1 hypothetical protein [Blastocatellia bacterium]HBE82494.1 hypothetical protein [Blastocatellia bacterium]HRJ88703.1 hypothetical protein [Pyrinomonadaceae bacterium]HRK51265.1 hypothetical protein [Pyrinomonadaceae bacterium]